MNTIMKSAGMIALYALPSAVVYFLSTHAIAGFHVTFSSLAEHIPSLGHYAACAQNSESVKSLHFFNIFYSAFIPFCLFKRVIVKEPEVRAGTVMLGLVLTAFGLLLMLFGFPMETADGLGSVVAQLYCKSEIASFATLTIMAAGASVFYLIFIVFAYLYLKQNKLIS